LQSLRKNISKILRISSEKKARNLVFFLVFFEEKDIVYLENKMSIKQLINEKNMEQRTSSFICFIDAQWHIMTQGVLKAYFPEDLKTLRSNNRGRVLVLDAKTCSMLRSQIPKEIAEVVILPEEFGNGAVYPAVDGLFNQDRELFFIGDMSLYNAIAASIDRLYITQVDCEIKDSDSIFPEAVLEQWECVSSSQYSESKGCPYPYSCREYKEKSL
jgi:dihydrofolate reductase